jgi:glycosyltransferase involved in cell wall biosynthesis
MRLTILHVAYAFAAVRADASGGAEQVLGWLDRALVRSGHRSLVIAREDSSVAGDLIGVPPVDGSLESWTTWHRAHEHHRAAIARTLREFDVDLVHMHGLNFNHYLPRDPEVPVLVTLHLPPSWYGPTKLAPARPRTFLNCVSESQRHTCPPDVQISATIHNGVPLEQFKVAHRKRGYALTLARMCPEKGVHIALDAARRAQVQLFIGGELFPSRVHCDYFNEQIAPRLNSTRRFLGPIRGARKARLLASARCVLVPSLAPETSSLVAMEALASGTPVVAFRSGALSEIVEHGRTGFIVQNQKEMADAIRAAGALDPAVCRATAEARFSAERMADQYLTLYRRLVHDANTQDVQHVA